MSAVVCGRPFESEFAQAFKDYPYAKKPFKLYPWPVRVLVYPTKAPRRFDDMLVDLGRGIVEAVLDGTPTTQSGRVLLVFPERWMTPKEDQEFMPRLLEHPVAKAITAFDCITNSPIAIGHFYAET